MRNSPPKYFRALLFCLLISTVAFGQLSKKHFIPPLTYSEFGNAAPQDQYIYISTPNNLDVTYTITPIGQPASSVITGTVTNNNPDEIFIGNGPGQLFQPSPESSTVVTDRGYIIDAEDVIYVSIRMRAGNSAQAGALVSKGTAALGRVFRSGSFTNENPQDNYLNFFSVMATEDDTRVTIDNLPAGISIRNYTGTFPINVILNEGESYVVATNSDENVVNRDGLIGTLIESDKPIVMNAGSTNGSNHNGNGRDYGIDQIVGLSSVGDEYIFVRGDGSDVLENILIVAHEDDTDIFINDNTTSTATINAGEYYLIEGNEYNSNGNMYVQTSKNVFVYQGVGGNGNQEPNQGMFFVPPLNCNNSGSLNSIANIQNIGTRIYIGGITIVTNKGSDVQINGQPIADFSPQGPFDVDGNPDYETYKVLGLNDNVSVVSTGELYCAYFNFNGVATSGSFYSGFPAPPEIDFNLDVTSAGNCIPNITLEAFAIDVFDTLEWHYDDGSGFVGTGDTGVTYKPLQPGGYKLVGTILCSGLTMESASVQVAFCPDDFDGDLIIDNLDVDIDNDGVLNCDESLGDVTLDLTNFLSPELIFQDGTVDGTFANAQFDTFSSSGNVNDFTSDNNGNFTTTVASAINASVEYRMDFQEAVNIEFHERAGYNHTSASGEVFSIIIGPSTQNITLLDPDNTILVDTDFDGIFEAGVDNFSTSEIRFRYNPSPSGIRPFRFVASQIDHVIFRHQLSNTAQQSSFQGHLRLTCFSLDSDNDGQADAFDLDNDNDGIPDLLEASGRIISLSNSDSDFDGLDDVFNNIGVIPADTDSDGIPDFLDLDSDNDGIFDLFEARHGLLDSDLNGVIDNAATTSGSNGLVDDLETIPDSFVLNYIVANTDNDNFLNATELDSDDDSCPDVTEAGFSDGDGDQILHISPVTVDDDGIVLNTPDGYTIPNDNYIIFAPIIINTPLTDVAFCADSQASIFIDTTADIFQWQVSTNGTDWNDITNDDTYNGATTNTLNIQSVPNTFNGYQYRVLLERTGNSCSEISNAVTLTVHPLPVLESVVLNTCDDDQDGIFTFDLLSALPLLSLNHSNETFLFYRTQADAENNTNAISNVSSYTNSTPTSETLWVRVTSTEGCYTITSIELYVSTTTIPTSFLRTFNACDDYLDINGVDNGNNDDQDGISSFDFSSVTADVLNLFPNNQQLNISFYENEIDAQDQSDEITNLINYRNIESPNSQNIYIRIDDIINNTCTHIGPYIQLTVDPVPDINPATDLLLCDDDNDGFIQGFNLENNIAEILGGQDPSNFTLSFHLSEQDARDNLNPITNTTSFENTVALQQSIYVRLVNNTTGCSTGGIAFDVIASQLPVPDTVDNFVLCDDDTDGSALNGILQNIDLDSTIPEILGSLDPNIHEVSFHLSLSEADSGSNPIVSPFTNTIPFSQTIYIRLLNTDTGCHNTDSFEIIINPEPEIQTIADQNFCDDDADGFLPGINLENLIPSILGTLDPSDFTVSFHGSLFDAQNGDAPLSSPFTNTTANEQQIFVRVINNTTGCINTRTSFNIAIQPLPIVNQPPNIEQCDDDTDGMVSGFNLDAQSSIILGNLDPVIHPVSYHLSELDANSGMNPISNTISFTNTVPNLQTIYVRVGNASTGCATASISFDLIVHPIPEVTVPNDLIFCDEGLVDNSTTNGIVHNIDLDQLSTDILGDQDPTNFQVSYHLNSDDSLTGDNPIASPFSNTVAFSQTIYIRVINTLTSCLDARHSFQIIVQPAPTIHKVDDLALCDDDEDGDDANGFVQNIDLDSQIPDLLGSSQNPDDFTVTFHETLEDAVSGNNALTSPYSNTVAFSQTLFVRIENNSTGCISFGRFLTIEIRPLPQFDVISPQFICLGVDVLELGVENPLETYDYAWTDANGNTTFGETLTVTAGGIYSVTATSTDGSNCSKTKDIVVTQSSAPTLTDEDVIIDDGDDDNSISVNDNPGALGIGDYEFALLDNDGNVVYDYQNSGYFGNLRGGIYTILVRDKNGCGEAQLEVAVLEIPRFFTPNNDGVNDFWNLKGISDEFIDYFPSTKISVFNRFGKFIADFTIDQQGWNGSYNGKIVISNDYWARVKLIDRNGKVRVEMRNFALLRR